ncbi:DNA-3-methyladenine glycosylase family protein [Deinococcus saxicola]|uniref:DNA-3-methyladenine glycosylase family protein n=1 Tax=Deinococcus saxicola TaxID=249406 RepID=UPI0039F0225B
MGIRIQQGDNGKLRAQLLANPDGASSSAVRAGLGRILSLDTDASGFAKMTARDEVVAGLVQRHPGVRPLLYPSPYEAAARAIIGQRLFVRQASAVTARIAELHGVRLDVGSHVLHAFPAPERLASLPPIPRLAERKVEQLQHLGRAALDGHLSAVHLRSLLREEAVAALQQLPGIGPFSADLILIRGVGDPDAFPRTELKLQRAMASAYHLGDAPSLETVEQIAAGWRPYRSWVGLLLRNFGES